jgi:uncharacterized protein (TIGR03437 family)
VKLLHLFYKLRITVQARLSDTGTEMTRHIPHCTILLILAACCGPLFGQAPSISPGGVVDAASFSAGRPVSAGNIVAIFGNNLAAQVALADTVPLSTSLSNVTVSFNGIAAPLQFVAPGQINAQIPWDVLPAGTSGTVNAVVTSQGLVSPPEPVVINPFGPGVYAATFSGIQHAVAINATDPTSARFGSFAAPVGTVGAYPAFPAQVNDILLVYAGGLGAVDTPIASGAAPTVTIQTLTLPTVLVNGVPGKVLFSGLAPGFPGIYQVNAMVPQVAAGNTLPFQLQIGGITSTPATTIAVQ